MNVTENILTVPGGKMPYIRFGSGKRSCVIVAGMTLAGIEGLAEPVSMAYAELTEDYTVYLFERTEDVPGGRSVSDMADDIACAMKSLGISDADFMGASQGGMIVLYVASRYPELVHSVVPVSSCARLNDAAKKTLMSWKTLAERGDKSALVRDFFDRVYKYPNAEALSAAQNSVTDAQIKRFLHLADAALNYDCTDELKKIKCPVFVVGVKNDRVLGAGSSGELAEMLGCDSFIYPDFEHGVYDEAPDFKKKLLGFYRSIR